MKSVSVTLLPITLICFFYISEARKSLSATAQREGFKSAEKMTPNLCATWEKGPCLFLKWGEKNESYYNLDFPSPPTIKVGGITEQTFNKATLTTPANYKIRFRPYAWAYVYLRQQLNFDQYFFN
jgi:hypothetical protein